MKMKKLPIAFSPYILAREQRHSQETIQNTANAVSIARDDLMTRKKYSKHDTSLQSQIFIVCLTAGWGGGE